MMSHAQPVLFPGCNNTQIRTQDNSEIVYRVLRPEEDEKGLIAHNPNAEYSVFHHVLYGHLKTQFISTCKYEYAVMEFAKNGDEFAKKKGIKLRKIVSIDLALLQKRVPCEIIDLTQEELLKRYILTVPLNPYDDSKRIEAKNYATAFKEVLIKLLAPAPIPAECVHVIKEWFV